MNEIMVGELREFKEGDYRVLKVEDFEFGIYRQGDRLFAYENHCPHDGGPVCQGKVIPRVEEETRFPHTIPCLIELGLRSVCALPLSTVHRRLGSPSTEAAVADRPQD